MSALRRPRTSWSPGFDAPWTYVDRRKDIILAPDCGMKYLPRALADAKLRAMVAGAAIVRAELS